MRISIIAVCGVLAGCAGVYSPRTMPLQGLEGESTHAVSWLTPQGAVTAPGPALRATPVAQIAPARNTEMLEPAAPAGIMGSGDQLCEASARQDSERNWFDAQTRERVYHQRLVQCRALLAQQPPFN
jgi:hypothetical protein